MEKKYSKDRHLRKAKDQKMNIKYNGLPYPGSVSTDSNKFSENIPKTFLFVFFFACHYFITNAI